ncbi:MAG: hypothetical protein K9H49_06025 [Bacteroidales bacterium]|nr:hypothetical protein [Bacteroidales bacterium]MCF8405995.1 hypothetical protein [Bacteroidales bacterium]
MNRYVLFLLFIVSFLLDSCVEKELDFSSIKSQNWESKWAIPLIDSRLTLEDFLNDTTGIINTNENGLITLVYQSEELISFGAGQITAIPDQEKLENKNFDLPLIPPGISGEVPVQFSFTFELEEEGLRIDSIISKSGYYHFKVITNLNRDVANANFTVPNFVRIDNGQPLNFPFDFSNPEGLELLERDTLIDLSNYILVFDHAFSDTNEVVINCIVYFEGDENPVNNPYFITIDNAFTDLDFYRFYGYAGHRSISMDDTISLSLFNINDAGSFSFGEGSVKLTIDVLNSFGLPVLLDITTFRAYHGGSEPDSVDVWIFGQGSPSVIELNSPNINQVGEYAFTEVITENSNINEVLDISPNKMYVEILGDLNYDENPDNTNFVLDTSAIKIDLSLELELFGSAENFKIADTVDFNMNNLDEIESLVFVVSVNNGFPINAEVQLEFVDSVYNVVQTLLQNNEMLMLAAPVSSAPDYKVIFPTNKVTEIEIIGEELKNLQMARKILITAILSTTSGQVVKIYDDYDITLQLGAKIGLSF